ncbi:hypothetical protein M3Y98_01036900 [Aphelenchoides besseyi]|nr:hypothetical protein M3Y98_01036900 [Aphelenchoides besseyi]KAI6209916.1 hypothetical protein M3Y96_00271800 [Aphelenchoides besseyi]
MTRVAIINAIHELRFAVALLFGSISVHSQGSCTRTRSESKIKSPKKSHVRPSSQMHNISPAIQQFVATKVASQEEKPRVSTVRKSKNEKNPTRKNEVDERKPVACLDSNDEMKVGTNGAAANKTESKPEDALLTLRNKSQQSCE